jgi:demethoxyubiquinone hydroxylase (CLK1/Coq7/Cat5 family)
MATFNKSEKTVEQLNSFLRGEISAVETYRIALDKIESTSSARSQLETCRRSHEDRVAILKSAIQAIGGTPSESSGPWGVFAKAVEGGGALLGDKIAVAALEEGEDHGLKDYRGDLNELDPEARQLVMSCLLPQQEQTHRTMSSLKKSFKHS